MTGWPELTVLLDGEDLAAIAAAVRDLTADQRRELLGPLKEYERAARGARWNRQPMLAIAGAGVLPNASTMAPWLVRNDMTVWRERSSVVPLVMDLLVARDVSWLGDLAERLAGRLSANPMRNRSLWDLTEKLVRLTGIDVPTTDGYVACWVTDGRVVDRIREDPRHAVLITRMFEVPQALQQLDRPYWPTTMRTLADDGLVDRATLIDACVGALQRGGRVRAIAGCLKVFDALDLTLDELAGRVHDLVALLPDAPSTVAGMAQRELRRVDDAGRLPVSTLCEASRAVLYRTEKNLARTQLTWLDEVAGRDGIALDDVLRAAATAFTHEATDIQQRALTVITKHMARSDARTELAEAAATLPADLRARAAETFGEIGAADDAAPVLVPAPPAREIDGPIGSPEELAAEITAIWAGFPNRLDPIALERVLAGLVATSRTDRPGLADALAPFLKRHRHITPDVRLPHTLWGSSPLHEYDLLSGIVGSAVYGPTRPDGDPEQVQRTIRERLWGSGPAPMRFVFQCRLAEIAVCVGLDPRPRLLSTPTTHTGLIAPDELVERVRQAQEEGWQPWPIDLAQALARLPRDPDPAAARRASQIGGPAADALAARLIAGAPDPTVTVVSRPVTESHHKWDGVTETTEERLLATVTAEPGGLIVNLATPERWPEGYRYVDQWMSCWPMILPGHPDVTAANLMPELFQRTRSGRGTGHLLPMLAEADGPAGPVTHLALAYGLGAKDQTDRAAAVDAVVTLAGGDRLDGTVLGEHVAELVVREVLLLNRVIPALRDVARCGAYRQLWAAVAAALPRLLPPAVQRPPRLLADLVALGVTLAEPIRPTDPFPCLDTITTGSSQVAVQARRLRAILTS